MKSVTNDQAREILPPASVFDLVIKWLGTDAGNVPNGGIELAAPLSPVVAKVGEHGAVAGARLRFSRADNPYVTVVRYADGGLAAVESTYLTYARTAALAVVGPWVDRDNWDGHVLVCGGGRLAAALNSVIRPMFGHLPDIWLRGSTGRQVTQQLATSTAVVFTATSAREPLPIFASLKSPPRWIVLSGSVRSAKNLEAGPDSLIERANWSDVPWIAEKRNIMRSARALSSLVRGETFPDSGGQNAVICGGGPIDVMLAEYVANQIGETE